MKRTGLRVTRLQLIRRIDQLEQKFAQIYMDCANQLGLKPTKEIRRTAAGRAAKKYAFGGLDWDVEQKRRRP